MCALKLSSCLFYMMSCFYIATLTGVRYKETQEYTLELVKLTGVFFSYSHIYFLLVVAYVFVWHMYLRKKYLSMLQPRGNKITRIYSQWDIYQPVWTSGLMVCKVGLHTSVSRPLLSGGGSVINRVYPVQFLPLVCYKLNYLQAPFRHVQRRFWAMWYKQK